MYTLYRDKKDRELKVQKAKEIFTRSPLLFTEEVTAYNNCYYFCKNRKPLVKKAEEIRTAWATELEYQLHKVNSIKI